MLWELAIMSLVFLCAAVVFFSLSWIYFKHEWIDSGRLRRAWEEVKASVEEMLS